MLWHHHYLVGSAHEIFEHYRWGHRFYLFNFGMDKQGRLYDVWNYWRFRDVFLYSIEGAIFT